MFTEITTLLYLLVTYIIGLKIASVTIRDMRGHTALTFMTIAVILSPVLVPMLIGYGINKDLQKNKRK